MVFFFLLFFFGKVSWEWERVCQGKQESFSQLWLSHKGILLRDSFIICSWEQSSVSSFALLPSCSRIAVSEIGLKEPHASCHYQHKSYTLGKRKSIRWTPSNWCFRREITWGKMDPSRKALKRSKTWETTTTKLQLFQEDLILNETNSSCYLFKMPFVFIYCFIYI